MLSSYVFFFFFYFFHFSYFHIYIYIIYFFIYIYIYIGIFICTRPSTAHVSFTPRCSCDVRKDFDRSNPFFHFISFVPFLFFFLSFDIFFYDRLRPSSFFRIVRRKRTLADLSYSFSSLPQFSLVFVPSSSSFNIVPVFFFFFLSPLYEFSYENVRPLVRLLRLRRLRNRRWPVAIDAIRYS